MKTIYCRVILLNRRRPGEVERIFVETYVDCSKNQESYEDFQEAVSNTERILLQNLKRIVIRGKGGKPVPVLYSTFIQARIAELLKFRAKFLKEDNAYLLGNPGFQSSIVGYKVVSKYAASCGAKNPKTLTCTKLRKHLATLTQLFNMNDNEIDQLARFIDHTVGEDAVSEHSEDENDAAALVFERTLIDEVDQSDERKQKKAKQIVNKKRRVLIPWTEEQKQAVTSYFKTNISNGKPPIRRECEDLKKQHPDL
ncbi:hypothetical protein HHI36_004944 [Cryptolaemus montrouzieri]|uniref:Uncharacterized protein n=1 Tax=Cryptolaemus montrouzieri TaxID=559131 RepID=A0ABD2NSZ5_9CUCU